MPPALNGYFSASYDTATKIISVVVCAGFLVAAVAIHNIAIVCLAPAIIILAFAFSPRAYVISAGSLTVKRLIGGVRIPLDGIREARAATKDDLRGGIRLWGNGGLFGYYGLFRTRALGVCSWYVTNCHHIVVIKTGAKTILFSPDDREGFLSAITAA